MNANGMILASTIMASGAVMAGAEDSVSLTNTMNDQKVASVAGWFRNQTVQTTSALLENAKSRNAVILIGVAKNQDVDIARNIASLALRKGVDILLIGDEKLIASGRPSQINVWPASEVMFISNRSKKRGIYFGVSKNAKDFGALKLSIEKTRQEISSESQGGVQIAKTRSKSSKSNWDFTLPPLLAQSPNEVCMQLRSKVLETVDDDTPQEALDEALTKVCQYGTVNNLTPNTPPDKTGYLGGGGNINNAVQPGANIYQEWLYLVSSDPVQPGGSRIYFWAQTLGEGAGTGFFHEGSQKGVAQDSGGAIALLHLLHPQIRTGWGPRNDVLYFPGAWCEVNQNASDGRTKCPIGPVIRALYPLDSYDDNVTVASSQGWNIGGNIGTSVAEGKPSANISLTGGYTSSTTTTQSLKMVLARTNANTIYSRATEWKPNWVAMKDLGSTSLVNTTPLADTINPSSSVVWALPLEANRNRPTKFVTSYEVKMESCFQSKKTVENCPSYEGITPGILDALPPTYVFKTWIDDYTIYPE